MQLKKILFSFMILTLIFTGFSAFGSTQTVEAAPSLSQKKAEVRKLQSQLGANWSAANSEVKSSYEITKWAKEKGKYNLFKRGILNTNFKTVEKYQKDMPMYYKQHEKLYYNLDGKSMSTLVAYEKEMKAFINKMKSIKNDAYNKRQYGLKYVHSTYKGD